MTRKTGDFKDVQGQNQSNNFNSRLIRTETGLNKEDLYNV